ncbi:MAG: hypothetical protein ACK58L_00930 [Planctomycetota bacterium]
MRYFYFSLCLIAAAATYRLAGQITLAIAGQKPSQTVLANVGTEPKFTRSDAAPQGVSAPSGAEESHSPSAAMSLIQPTAAYEAEQTSDAVRIEKTTAAGTAPIQASPDSMIGRIRQLPPVRHRGGLHDSMITPGNFEYVGAIRPPHIQQNGTTFAYGGWAIAYRSDGDSKGANDGFPGSLYLLGHQEHQKVAELSIPTPVNSRMKLADDLPIMDILQPFSDVTDGLLNEMTAGSSEHFHLGGMLVTHGLLHWTMHKYYNVENTDFPSHGTSGLNLQTSIAEGLWHLGPVNSGRPEFHSYKHAGYIFEIPRSEADRWFGGKSLISGLQISTGLQASSQGPAMFAYALPSSALPHHASIDAIPLVWYAMQEPLAGHHPADRWSGGAWLTLGNKQAVIIIGRKALGDIYYGEARPQDCTSDKGYHGPPYEAQMAFYSPASLIHAAHGKLQPAGLKPWLRWDGNSEGGGLNQYLFDTCNKLIGGMAYDRERNLLYIVQVDAGKTTDNEYETVPIIHVFRIIE